MEEVMMNKDRRLCIKCKINMLRLYIRRMTNGKSQWIPIGYICSRCESTIISIPEEFKIAKEESSGAGKRRIYAVIENPS